MSFRKNIESEDVLLSSFQTHKAFEFNDSDSGSGFFAVSLTKGTDATYTVFLLLPQLQPLFQKVFITKYQHITK